MVADLRAHAERQASTASQATVWTRTSPYTGGNPAPLSGTSLVKQLQRISKAAGLVVNGRPWVTPHVLRATGATIAANGAPPYLISLQLGHTRLQTTERYIRPDPREVLKGYGEIFRLA